MNIVVSMGAQEYVEVVITETTGATLTISKIEIGLRKGSTVNWHDATVSGSGSTRLARYLVTSTVPTGDYTIWVRITSSDEVSVFQVGDYKTTVSVS